MSNLLYRPDMDEVRRRMRAWWHDGDLGRPAMMVYAPPGPAREEIASLPVPAHWGGQYDWRDFDYRVHLARSAGAAVSYFAEAVPVTGPDVGPGSLALYLGCQGQPMDNTTWFEPCIADPDSARFEYDPANFFWDFTLRLTKAQIKAVGGKVMLQFPDLIEGLDILAAMRGNEATLFDLMERPAWVESCMSRITDLYFRYYDRLYDLMRDESGGSFWWMWAPGRMAKLQCDFSAMIGPDLFKQFMVPVLTEISERVSYCLYHWDGPGALVHQKHLLSIAGIDVIQWQPGAGKEPTWHPRWWPLYHDVLAAGKKLFISCDNVPHLLDLKREFGGELKRFIITMWMDDAAQAAGAVQAAQS